METLMIPEKENQQERCLHPSPGLQQPLAPGPPGRMIPWLRRMLGRGARAGGRERHHEVSSGVLEAQYSSVRNALGPVWLRGPEAMAKVQGCKVRRRTRRWHVPLLPSSPLPFLPFFLKSPSSLATSAPRLGLFSPGQAQSVHSPLLKAKPDHKTLDGARVWNREGSH